jgi:hypothetical protein
MADDLTETDIFMRLNLEFSAIQVLKNELITSYWTFNADLMPMFNLSVDGPEVTGALTKIRYWVDEVVNGSLMFSATNRWAVNQFIRRETKDVPCNNIILLPGSVHSSVIAKVLHAKIIALATEHLVVGPLEICSDDG